MDDVEALRARVKQLLGLTPATTARSAFLRGGANTFVDNVMGLPDLAVTTASQAAKVFTPRDNDGLVPAYGPIDVIGRAIREATGGRIDPIAAGEQYRRSAPTMGQRVLGLPRGDQVVSGALAVKDFIAGDGASPAAAYRARQEQAAQMQQEHPFASGAGEVVGDIATVVTGRLPLGASGRMAQGEKWLEGIRQAENMAPGLMRRFNSIYTSESAKGLAKAAGRAAETGLEGAALAVLKEGDPMTVGVFSAAGQLAGSGALALNRGLWPSGKEGLIGKTFGLGGRLAGVAFAGAALTNTLYQMTPMGEGNIMDYLQALDANYEHIALAVLAGAGAGLAGAGRLRGTKLGEDIPALEHMLTAGRATVLSVVTDAVKSMEEGKPGVMNTLNKLVSDPSVFNVTQLKQMQASIENKTFGETVERMIEKDPRFAAAVADGARDRLEDVDAMRIRVKRLLGMAPEPPPRGFIGR